MFYKLIPAVMTALLILCGYAIAQDDGGKPNVPSPKSEEHNDKVPKPDADEEKELTPEEAVKLLGEIVDLMRLSEEMLNDSSMGSAIEKDAETLKKIEELLKDEQDKEPSTAQGEALKKIEKLLRKTEKKQTQAIDRINEIIKRAKEGQGQGDPKKQQQREKDKKQNQQNKPKMKPNANNPATSPYDPNRNDPANPFKSLADKAGKWGELPPKVREQILQGEREIEKFPAEYQEMLKEYFKRLAEER